MSTGALILPVLLRPVIGPPCIAPFPPLRPLLERPPLGRPVHSPPLERRTLWRPLKGWTGTTLVHWPPEVEGRGASARVTEQKDTGDSDGAKNICNFAAPMRRLR